MERRQQNKTKQKTKQQKEKTRIKKKATIKKNKQTNAKRWDKREINESNTHSFYSIMIRLKRLN